MLNQFVRFRRPFIVILHVGIIAAANYLAFWLRFEGAIPPAYWVLFLRMLPWLIVVRAIAFVPFRLYEGLWRYTSVSDLLNIIGGVGVSTVAFAVVVRLGHGLIRYPRSVFVIDALILIVCLGGVRMVRRVVRDYRFAAAGRRVLVFGAGDAGEMIVRDMKNNPFYEYQPIGFVDDDVAKVGRRIHGVQVLGTRAQLGRIISEQQPDEVVVAIPRAEPAVIREVLRSLEPYKLPIKTLPNLRDILTGRVTVSQIRNLSVEDLLPRAPRGLDPERVRTLVEGRRVLVTGAGGSIGAELCRQIARLRPAEVVALDRYENGLFAIEREVRRANADVPFAAVIADITDAERIEDVFRHHRPEVVFHAAAHKHVPLMEANPCEAIKNNVFGTRIVAEAADRNHVSEFVLISSDKAVNPTSVMGSSKRVAELVVQSVGARSETVFVAVRFGNVLNSNGSVVPLFMEQIKAGGPVTVTDPHVRRFFMLIPEAVQLVLHAAALGERGAIYSLDMGDQIEVAHVARTLIRLAGFVPDQEISIVFTGLRPGEKMFEELVSADEDMTPSAVESIFRIQAKDPAYPGRVEPDVVALEVAAFRGDTVVATATLRRLVPTFITRSAPAPSATPQ
jgi:FlaA1/EpsC-like NDP-sugar epimerase